jgi:hypothetical protein
MTKRKRHRPIICMECGKTFTPTRADAVTCSNRCRQRRQRRRERDAAIKAALTEIKPLRKRFQLRRIEETLRATARRQRRARGHLQRAILDQLQDHEPVSADDLHPDRDATRAERVSILRAMHAIVRKFPQYALAGGKGRTPLYLYEPGNAHSAKRVGSLTWTERDDP